MTQDKEFTVRPTHLPLRPGGGAVAVRSAVGLGSGFRRVAEGMGAGASQL